VALDGAAARQSAPTTRSAPRAPPGTQSAPGASHTRGGLLGQISSAGSALEGVLDLLACLLQVGLRLIPATLRLQRLVVRRLADPLLGLAARLVHLVLDLVVETHRYPLFRRPRGGRPGQYNPVRGVP